MFQTCMFYDSRHVFITFFQMLLPFWSPCWTSYCNYFEPDFQARKIQKIQIDVLARRGYPGHITEEGGTRVTQEAPRRPAGHIQEGAGGSQETRGSLTYLKKTNPLYNRSPFSDNNYHLHESFCKYHCV